MSATTELLKQAQHDIDIFAKGLTATANQAIEQMFMNLRGQAEECKSTIKSTNEIIGLPSTVQAAPEQPTIELPSRISPGKG